MMTTNDDDGDKPNNFDLFAACSYAREHVRTVVSDGRTNGNDVDGARAI